jgi:uncharacterized protein (TIGR01777 family)
MNKTIAITGASGLLGSHLQTMLEKAGHTVIPISRRKNAPDSRFWKPSEKEAEEGILEGVNTIIHLSGEGIASGRWTDSKKKEILDSRVESTQFLCELIGKTQDKPKTLICASGIGYYGDSGDEKLTEASSLGEGFLAEVCEQWEQAAKEAESEGLRVISTRIGVVLSKKGGALQKMLPPFRLGGGGPLGDGQQFMSWISIEDACRAILFCIENEQVNGPVNLCSPEPVRNEVFSKALAAQLNRPCFFRVPASVIRIVFGKMGEELLLASNRAFPEKLVDSGFTFTNRTINSAFESVLGTE